MAAPFVIPLALAISSLISYATSSLANNKFVELTKQPYFLDKTDFFVTFFSSDDHEFFALPPGFGKTTILKMIKAYAQAEMKHTSLEPKPRNDTETYHLFKNFDIAHQSELSILVIHLNKYPVFFLDLKVNITENTSREDLVKIFNRILQPAYQEYSIILRKLARNEEYVTPEIAAIWREKTTYYNTSLNGNILDYEQIVDNLRRFINIMNLFIVMKPILLVDNYDYLAMEWLSKGGSFESGGHNGYKMFYEMVNEAISRAIPEMQRVIFAGVSGRISTNDSSTWPMQKYSFMDDHKYTEYFGIVESELNQLLDNYSCTDIEKQNVRDHYKGHHMPGNQSALIYNPYSITKCLESKKPNQTIQIQNYWMANQSHRFLELALQKSSFREKIHQVVDQGSIKVSRKKEGTLLNEMIYQSVWPNFDDDCLLHFLYELGYFTHGKELDTYDVVNAEVRQGLKKILAEIKIQGIESTSEKKSG